LKENMMSTEFGSYGEFTTGEEYGDPLLKEREIADFLDQKVPSETFWQSLYEEALDCWVESVQRNLGKIHELKKELLGWEERFNLYYLATMRGIKMWQAEHPERGELVWPDQGELICWLIEQLDEEKKPGRST
jgi:hypothetical protein